MNLFFFFESELIGVLCIYIACENVMKYYKIQPEERIVIFSWKKNCAH